MLVNAITVITVYMRKDRTGWVFSPACDGGVLVLLFLVMFLHAFVFLLPERHTNLVLRKYTVVLYWMQALIHEIQQYRGSHRSSNGNPRYC